MDAKTAHEALPQNLGRTIRIVVPQLRCDTRANTRRRAQTATSLPPTTQLASDIQLANGIHLANCYRACQRYIACQLPPSSLSIRHVYYKSSIATVRQAQLAISRPVFCPTADHISLVVIRRGNPPTSRQSRPQGAGAISEW
jgi:hypothetical protein